MAARSAEVTGTPLARVLLEEPVVLYRRKGGATVALEDRWTWIWMGAPEKAFTRPEFPATVEREERLVRLKRWILDRPPPPLYKKAGNFPGNVVDIKVDAAPLAARRMLKALIARQ